MPYYSPLATAIDYKLLTLFAGGKDILYASTIDDQAIILC